MLNSSMKYGAVRAKVMAMEGKLLKNSDFAHLKESRSFQDIVNYLRSSPGWSETVASIPAPVTPEKLSDAVTDRVWEDSEKLYHFSTMDDKAYLRFSTCRAEYELILTALRRLNSSEPDRVHPVPDYVKNKCSVDSSALAVCTSWDEVLTACRDSIYYKELSKLELDPETHLPNYSQACVMLENTYYRELFRYVSHKYRGAGNVSLKELIGRDADLLNIVSIMRLHKYFPGSLEKADKLLIPVSFRLSPELMNSLSHARSEAEALEILNQTKYGERFSGEGDDRLESVYEDAMSDFCDRIVHTGEPSVSTAQSYLVMKDMECRRLKRIIEAVRSGVDPEKAG